MHQEVYQARNHRDVVGSDYVVTSVVSGVKSTRLASACREEGYPTYAPHCVPHPSPLKGEVVGRHDDRDV